MPFLPASLSWAPIITMGSRPGGPTTDLPTVKRPLQPAPGAVMAAPRAMPGLVMPGVRRTPGRPRGGDARGGPDPPPCPGYFIAYMAWEQQHVNQGKDRTRSSGRSGRGPAFR